MDSEPSDKEVCNEFTYYKRWWPTQRYQRRIAAILGGLFEFSLSGIVVWCKRADSPPYELPDLRYPEIILWDFLDIIIWDFSFLWYEHRDLLWILGLQGRYAAQLSGGVRPLINVHHRDGLRPIDGLLLSWVLSSSES